MKKKVLILCTGNACRSQMAEGVLRHFGHSHFHVESAGVKPSKVHPLAVQVMEEIGIDISGHRSKGMSEFFGKAFDYVITVCDNARETCPVFPGQGAKVHWSFPDPPHNERVTDEVMKEFRRVRDMIVQKFRPVAESGKITLK